jgi:hypothetical protein
MGPIAKMFGNPAGVSGMAYQEIRYWYSWYEAYRDAEKEGLEK